MILIFSFFSCHTEPTVQELEQKLRQNTNSELEQIADFEHLLSLDIDRAVFLCQTETKTKTKTDFMKSLQKKCSDLLERPHLFQQKKEQQSTAHQFHSIVDPLSLDCTDYDSERECILQNTKHSVMRGEIERVAGLCNHLQESWRGECYFHTAEYLVQSKGSSGYSDGVELCLGATPFVKNCMEHLIMQLAQFAPSSLTSQKADWNKIYSAENAIRSAWSFRDKKKMEENIERLWSESLGIAYFNSTPITGDPFDALEERHHVHIRSAAMRRLLAIDAPNTKNIEDWIAEGEQALIVRENGSAYRDRNKNNFLAVSDLWTESASISENIVYMATSRRPTHKDPHIDMILAILEGAARRPPNNKILLEEATKYPHPLVQESAQRLLEQQK